MFKLSIKKARIEEMFLRNSPKDIHLKCISSFYTPSHVDRKKEIYRCLERNAQLSFVELHLTCETQEDLEYVTTTYPNVFVHFVTKRPTFASLIDIVQQNAHNNTIFLLMNSDIELTESLHYLRYVPFESVKYALILQRWDKCGESWKLEEHGGGSQDVWIWKTPIKPIQAIDFHLGVRGCDNSFAYHLSRQNYVLFNPAWDIHTFHHHESNVRADSYSTLVIPPPYKTCSPQKIQYTKEVPLTLQKEYSTAVVVCFENRCILESFKQICSRVFCINATSPRMNEDLISLLDRYPYPDIIFIQIQGCADIDLRVVAKLRMYSTRTKIINWTGDARVPIPDWYYDMSKHVSITLFSNETDVDTFKQKKLRSAFFNIGFDDKLYTSQGPLLADLYDVVFMGNNYNNVFELSEFRIQIVESLRNTFGDRFGLFGGNWNHSNGNLMKDPETEAKVYRSTKIAISLSHYDLERYFSDRMLRIMGCGALCMAKWYPGIEKDFKDGYHVVVWKDLEDLHTKINYYLTHPEERLVIAKRGCELVHTKHTWKHRMEQLVPILNSIHTNTTFRNQQRLNNNDRVLNALHRDQRPSTLLPFIKNPTIPLHILFTPRIQ
jgi:glycosyltransferase involved in cell wall biosynthesis